MALASEPGLIKTDSGKLKVLSAEDWITEEDTPDPVIKRVMNEYVVIRPLVPKSVSKGGIILAGKVQDNLSQLVTVGRVIGVGEFAGVRPGVSKPNIGDYVVFPKNGGAFVKVQDVKVVILIDDAILMEIDKDTVLSQAV